MVDLTQIKDHSEVVGSDGVFVGVVDHIDAQNGIKLTKNSPNSGEHHHYIPVSWVDKIVDNQLILNKTAKDATSEWKSA